MINQFVTIKRECISLGLCTGIDNNNQIIWIRDFSGKESAISLPHHTKGLRVSFASEVEKGAEKAFLDYVEEESKKIDVEYSESDFEDFAYLDYEGINPDIEEEKEEEEEGEEGESYLDLWCKRWDDAYDLVKDGILANH